MTILGRFFTFSNGSLGFGSSDDSPLSSDGRVLVFESDSASLAPGDTNGHSDIFIRNVVTGVLTRISVGPNSAQGNGDSKDPAVSADGNFVVFESSASNLAAGDTNASADIFRLDLQTGALLRVSTSSNGAQANDKSEDPAISSNGRFVVFSSEASNLVTGDTNSEDDVFIKDTQTGILTRVSTSSSGAQGNGESEDPSVSADGRYVVFESEASNLVAGDTNAATDIFLKDMQTGALTRISTTSDGAQANGASGDATISADGRLVAFRSSASNLFAGDTNNSPDVFVKDLQTGIVTRVSLPSGHGSGNDELSGDDSGNILCGGSGDDNLSGGGGRDVAEYSGSRSAYMISRSPDGARIVLDSSSGRDGRDTLSGVERLHFNDGYLAFDTTRSDTGGQGYLLYRAAFHRTPDADGLGYWVRELDRGVNYADVAENFIASAEFTSRFGANLTSAQFLDLLYQNVLGRAGDADGVNYWMAQLNSGYARENLLASFAVSNENFNAVSPLLTDGVWFT